MKNYDKLVEINDNPKWPYIPDHLYRILIIGDSGSGKINVLLNLIKQQQDIDRIYLYTKDPFKSTYRLLINGRKKVDSKEFKISKNIYWLFTNSWKCLWELGKAII